MTERILKMKPYKVSNNRTVLLNELVKLKPGDKVYETITEDGIIKLYPQKLFEKKYTFDDFD